MMTNLLTVRSERRWDGLGVRRQAEASEGEVVRTDKKCEPSAVDTAEGEA